ncbi:hypothetical protein COY07_06070 [Candidatus Peregrinibacteria bacterium CG_4_10_14_0_2_um_filter_43_11]|nr:MAG: hypothetical protein COY07_06070 [Candidatus Peregrinibacteria bacterium CG_4_10_14_0_2_um_filter_43_11]
MYYGARYYDPVIGRFTSMDPWEGDLKDPQTLNKYSYARNNPVRYVDPTGEKVSDYQPYLALGDQYISGELLGTYKGVNITSPGSAGSWDHPYQCVSFVKDFVLHNYNLNLNWTGNAVDYGNEVKLNAALSQNHKNAPVSGQYKVYNNGESVMPQEDDIISWSGGAVGHVGIIAEVVFNDEKGTGQIYTIEQNYSGHNGLFSQSFTRTNDENGNAFYTVGNRSKKYKVQGWARYENQTPASGEQPKNYTKAQHTPATQTPKNQPITCKQK